MNVLPIAIIGIVAAILAFDKRYEDGLIRHITLFVMVVASIVICFGPLWSDYEYDFPTELQFLLWAFAIFFICHAYSFIRWRLTGSNDWTKQKVKQ